MKSAWGLILVMVFVGSVFGQSGSGLRFEVASVKSSPEAAVNASPGIRSMTGGVRIFPGGRLATQSTILRTIVQSAYGLKPYQLFGGPQWIDSARYDIQAKAESSEANSEQLLLMLRSLLAEEFKLEVHKETRQLAVYDLVVAKGGLKLRPPSEENCYVPDPSKTPPLMQPGQPLPPCGRVAFSAFSTGPTPGGQLNGGQVTMADLVGLLSNVMGRTVIDKTGFTDKFDVHLSFSPDASMEGLPPLQGPRGAPVTLAEDPSNGTIFSEIQKQLGLKLESSKGPVEVIVIDRLEKPAGR